MIPISDQEFAKFQGFIFDEAGITLSASKKALVSGRLEKRLRHHKLASYADYLQLLASPRAADEAQIAVDLLTTNETYFFREPKHFELLRELASAAKPGQQPLRVWSAASSSGEEVYSIAMVLADCLGEGRAWEVMGSDISTRVLRRARIGHYPAERTAGIPDPYLKRFCLKGIGVEAGTMLVQKSLRQRVQFSQVNLNKPLPQLGLFDVIFLRNVMIYFNAETKKQVIARLVAQLKPGGHLLVGHSETLNEISTAVKPVSPSVYVKT